MLYFDIFRFSFIRFFAYPYEIVASGAKTLVEIVFLIIFWSLYSKSAVNSPGPEIFASYFLIASGINNIVMSQWGEFGSLLGISIRSGAINNILLKPYNLLPAMYFNSLGKDGINIIIALITITLGLALQTPSTLVSLILFILFLICAFLISYSFNVLQGTLFLYSPDATGIRNSVNHIIAVLSGLMIPIYLFPEPFKRIIELSPFPWMVYGPVHALQTPTITPDVLTNLAVAMFWGVTLSIFSNSLWHKSLKRYEAIGI